MKQKPILNYIFISIFFNYVVINPRGMSMREKVSKLEENNIGAERFTTKERLNLNDLLRRRSEEKKVDKKTNLLIVSSLSVVAAGIILILSF